MAGTGAKLQAWVKGHKPEAAGLGVGAVALVVWWQKSHSSSAASTTSSTSGTSTGTAVSPSVVTVPQSTGATDQLAAELQQTNDQIGTLKASDSKLASESAIAGGVAHRLEPLPSGTKHAAIVDVVPAPGGGNWDLSQSGQVFSLGGAPFLGDYEKAHPKGPKKSFHSLVPLGAEAGGGYAEIDSDGQVYRFHQKSTAPKKPAA